MAPKNKALEVVRMV